MATTDNPACLSLPQLTASSFVDATLSGVQLNGSNFAGSDLEGAVLSANQLTCFCTNCLFGCLGLPPRCLDSVRRVERRGGFRMRRGAVRVSLGCYLREPEECAAHRSQFPYDRDHAMLQLRPHGPAAEHQHVNGLPGRLQRALHHRRPMDRGRPTDRRRVQQSECVVAREVGTGIAPTPPISDPVGAGLAPPATAGVGKGGEPPFDPFSPQPEPSGAEDVVAAQLKEVWLGFFKAEAQGFAGMARISSPLAIPFHRVRDG